MISVEIKKILCIIVYLLVWVVRGISIAANCTYSPLYTLFDFEKLERVSVKCNLKIKLNSVQDRRK